MFRCDLPLKFSAHALLQLSHRPTCAKSTIWGILAAITRVGCFRSESFDPAP
jgi:hypothetical protein